MAEIKGIIVKNDPGKKRKRKKQQLNFSISTGLHLDVKDLLTSVQRRRNVKINLNDFYEEILAKGVREFDNR